MRIPIGFLAGILLSALSSACAPAERIAEAKSAVRSGEQPPRVIIKTIAGPVRPTWRLGSPVAHENLTIFPIISEEAPSTVEFITLEEGLRSGKVTVSELGANGRARRLRRGQRVSDSAEVNKLAVTNNSGKMLVLIAGEVVVGGKQDRIVGHDCIIASTNTPVTIDVFCVEHGRWQEQTQFGQSRGSTDNDQADARSGGGNFTASVGVMAAPDVREKAQAKKSQSEVWSKVAETVAVNSAQTSTGTLSSVYKDDKVKDRVGAYEQAFKSKLTGKEVVGVVVAVAGKLVAVDAFASPALFQAYWPKLLKSYAVQTVSTASPGAQQVKREEAEAFLARVEGTDAANKKEGVYRLVERQSSTDASFELEHVTDKPMLIHYNRVSKK